MVLATESRREGAVSTPGENGAPQASAALMHRRNAVCVACCRARRLRQCRIAGKLPDEGLQFSQSAAEDSDRPRSHSRHTTMRRALGPRSSS